MALSSKDLRAPSRFAPRDDFNAAKLNTRHIAALSLLIEGHFACLYSTQCDCPILSNRPERKVREDLAKDISFGPGTLWAGITALARGLERDLTDRVPFCPFPLQMQIMSENTKSVRKIVWHATWHSKTGKASLHPQKLAHFVPKSASSFRTFV